MMKGTYACLKYGAYYVMECQRRTLRTALIANIDPSHQYADYLEKLEDIRWGHSPDFKRLDAERDVINSSRLTYLFDSVFTFNRQILNDAAAKKAWDLERFLSRLRSGELDSRLAQLRQD